MSVQFMQQLSIGAIPNLYCAYFGCHKLNDSKNKPSLEDEAKNWLSPLTFTEVMEPLCSCRFATNSPRGLQPFNEFPVSGMDTELSPSLRSSPKAGCGGSCFLKHFKQGAHKEQLTCEQLLLRRMKATLVCLK